ncbi:MAG: hypothetical protein A2079_05240 [Geobacteraceae bacterium GWC2_48_7]|nr:MAG: hypothetical protein A2079_05240 [Geobacteraceae bacterium GWC2_48_7]
MPRTLPFFLILITIYILYPTGGVAAEPGITAAGVRGGFQATPRKKYFHQYEAFARFGLPWEWRFDEIGIAPQIELSAGNLHSNGKDGFIGSLGPNLNLDFFDRKLDLVLGINLLYIMERSYDGQDFGNNLMFGAHIGLDYLLFSGLKAGYRFQHMSLNKILYDHNRPNPGLDMHMFSLSWQF